MMSEDNVRKNLKKQAEDELVNLQFTRETHLKSSQRLEKKASIVSWSQIVLSAITTTGVIYLFLNETQLGKYVSIVCSAILFALSIYIKDRDLMNESKEHRQTAEKLFGLREDYSLLLSTFDIMSTETIMNNIKGFIVQTQAIYEKAPSCTTRDYKKAKIDIDNDILVVSSSDKDKTIPNRNGDANVD